MSNTTNSKPARTVPPFSNVQKSSERPSTPPAHTPSNSGGSQSSQGSSESSQSSQGNQGGNQSSQGSE